MASTVDESMNCKSCGQMFCPPIIQCKEGHSICGKCFVSSKKERCPICGHDFTSTRNHQLEELIEKLKSVTIKTPCRYANRGCKYELNVDEKVSHELECKSRNYECEGKTFCGWDCSWTGGYIDILLHFRDAHDEHTWMKFKTDFNIRIDMRSNIRDIQVIDFNDGQQLFLYKYKTDVDKKKAYWLIQYVGLRKQAAQYYYEFEIYNGIRKIKITEICESDSKPASIVFNSGRCIALSFKVIKSYLNEEGELPVRFRIMKMRKNSISNH